MPTIYSANESRVLVDGELIEGVTAIDYRRHLARENVYALGSAERVGLISGHQAVDGRLRVASTSAKLDGLDPEARFQMSAVLKHGEEQMSVNFDDCYLVEKVFELGVGGHGEAVYSFTATRVREERG